MQPERFMYLPVWNFLKDESSLWLLWFNRLVSAVFEKACMVCRWLNNCLKVWEEYTLVNIKHVTKSSCKKLKWLFKLLIKHLQCFRTVFFFLPVFLFFFFNSFKYWKRGRISVCIVCFSGLLLLWKIIFTLRLFGC